MKILDLFCGAGGAARGYADAGFDVVGVDAAPQPHFPYRFIRADWRDGLADVASAWTRAEERFAVHASPPCQRYSTMTKKWGERRPDLHPDLIREVREALEALHVPYVIENVVGAPLRDPVLLCGSMFNLRAGDGQLRRHRLFEIHAPGIVLPLLPPCAHKGRAIAVYGHAGGSSKRDGLKFGGTAEWRQAMGIEWMSGRELAEAIPPAFTRWIGAALRRAP